MEDTLRYFFSALFQGFAAIVTLGAMYFLYFFDKIESKKNDIKKGFEEFQRILKPEDREFVLKNDIMKYLKERYLQGKEDKPGFDITRFSVNKYYSLETKEKNIRKLLAELLTKAIRILIISLIGLFLSGYNLHLNYFLILTGIYLIAVSVQYFFLIKKTIIEITKE